MVIDESPALDENPSKAVEVERIIRTGTIWTAAGATGPVLALSVLLAAGWRPSELVLAAAIVWWLGVVAAGLGLALLVWAGCPVLGFGLRDAYRQKVFSIRVGIVLNLGGVALAALAILLSPRG